MNEQLELLIIDLTTGSVLIRWLVNWILLNRLRNTNYTLFSLRNGLAYYWPVLRHMAISEWMPWWIGPNQKTLKTISNILSVISYTGGLYLLFNYLTNKF